MTYDSTPRIGISVSKDFPKELVGREPKLEVLSGENVQERLSGSRSLKYLAKTFGDQAIIAPFQGEFYIGLQMDFPGRKDLFEVMVRIDHKRLSEGMKIVVKLKFWLLGF